MDLIDLRSDTVTLPTPAMREAMYRAELGDDVFGEDPTVNRLEEMAAERMGKEASLFVASGTMGNLVAMLSHCGRGEGVIMGDQSHTFTSEAGGSAALGGLYLRMVPNCPDGTLDPAQVEAAIPAEDIHHPHITLLCLENTHNFCGGTVLSPDYMVQAAMVTRRHGMALHLDGARVYNAAVALGVRARDLTAQADSVMFCLSKGLCAPVGSMLCGSTRFIARARQMRKIVGGGMRQAGVLAAAGIVALEQMVDRLQDDHGNARRLAEGIAAIPGLDVDLQRVQTNIVFFNVTERSISGPELEAALRKEGILVLAFNATRLRAVTHHGIERAGIERSLQAMRRAMNQ
jgi:threonine aldolase